MATMPLQGELKELFSGVLIKVGGKVKNWTRRYFVLKSDYCLYYYKDTSKGALGTISLRDPKFKARRGEPSDTPWPKNVKMECTMAIVTSHRTYCVYCSYSHEIEEWIRMLTKAREKLLAESSQRENKLLAGSSQVEDSSAAREETKPRLLSTSEVPEQPTYEAVYDEPEDSPNVTTSKKQEDQIESAYSLATEDEKLPVYEDVTSEAEVVEIYDDTVTAASSSSSKQDSSPKQERQEIQSSQQDQQQPLYDAVEEDSPKEPEQPVYEDVGDEPPKQPLYEPMEETTDKYVPDENSSSDQEDDEKTSNIAPPSLPPRNTVPPLPSRSAVSLAADSSPTTPHDGTTPPSATPPSPHRHSSTTSSTSTPPQGRTTPSAATPPQRKSTPPSVSPGDSPITPLSNSPATPHSESPSAVPDELNTPPSHKKPTPAPRQKPSSSPSTEAAGSEQEETEQENNMEQGLRLFKLQKQRLEQTGVEDEKKRAESIRILEDVAADPKISPSNKLVFAETMREVEHEKQLASEERLRWERERKKLEAERLQFEEEKRRMQEEMKQMRS